MSNYTYFKQVKNEVQVTMYLVENSHEAIASIDVFETVQMKKKKLEKIS